MQLSMVVCSPTVPPACLLDPSLGTHEYVTANGIKFHYVAAGDPSKPLMLFLHGFPEVYNYSLYYCCIPMKVTSPVTCAHHACMRVVLLLVT